MEYLHVILVFFPTQAVFEVAEVEAAAVEALAAVVVEALGVDAAEALEVDAAVAEASEEEEVVVEVDVDSEVGPFSVFNRYLVIFPGEQLLIVLFTCRWEMIRQRWSGVMVPFQLSAAAAKSLHSTPSATCWTTS